MARKRMIIVGRSLPGFIKWYKVLGNLRMIIIPVCINDWVSFNTEHY